LVLGWWCMVGIKVFTNVVQLFELLKHHWFYLFLNLNNKIVGSNYPLKKISIKELSILIISKTLQNLWFSWKNQPFFCGQLFEFFSKIFENCDCTPKLGICLFWSKPLLWILIIVLLITNICSCL
jgi:hypothetical protein